MKQKSLPEDFQVEELTEILPTDGPCALYRLTKRGLGTPEVVEAVLRRWKIRRNQVSFGGLKDKHALTVQWVTIDHGPRRDLRQTNFDLAYQGQVPRPFEANDIRGNRFRITLRDLSEEDVERAGQAVPAIGRDGLPNYFDQQRFGSVGQSGEFIARTWCEGDLERGLWLALADPNLHDRPEDRAQRSFLRTHWGDWPLCRQKLRRPPWRPIAAYLADHAGDFRGATELLRPDLRSLYAAAFQSFLWNRVLAALLRQECRPEQLADFSLGRWTLPVYRELDAAQREALSQVELPLPSARIKLEEGPMKELIDRVLAREGLELDGLRIKHPRRTFFSKGQRPALCFPAGLEQESGADELHPGRRKLLLRFDLPRGSYATILLRRIAIGP